MVTTVFHQYEVGMREACIEAKASKSFNNKELSLNLSKRISSKL